MKFSCSRERLFVKLDDGREVAIRGTLEPAGFKVDDTISAKLVIPVEGNSKAIDFEDLGEGEIENLVPQIVEQAKKQKVALIINNQNILNDYS